jgi:hypothetical protein
MDHRAIYPPSSCPTQAAADREGPNVNADDTADKLLPEARSRGPDQQRIGITLSSKRKDDLPDAADASQLIIRIEPN